MQVLVQGAYRLFMVTRIFNISAMKAISCRKVIFATYFVLYHLVVQSCNAVVDLQIGVLSPWNTSSSPDAYPFWATRTLGAVSLAVDEINTAGILGDRLLTFTYKDSDCDSKQASGSTVELHSTNQISSYVAPPCSTPCRSVTDLTDFWQKPTIAWFCAETERTNDKYLVRTYAPFTSIGNIATVTMDYYKWTSASIIFPSATPWETLAFHVKEHLDFNNFDVAWYYEYEEPLTLDKAKEILRDVRTVSHVIWLIVGGITTLESDQQLFMLAAHQLGMVNGAHVFLHIELYPDPGYTIPWMPLLLKEKVFGVSEDDLEVIMEEAFEALVLLTHRLPPDGQVKSFLESVNEAFADLSNTDSTLPSLSHDPKSLDKPASIMSAFLYDAIWMYALAVNNSDDTLIVDDDVNIFEKFLMSNISFTGMTGPVVLDSDGDRIYNFTIMDMKLQNSSHIFEAVGYLSGLSPMLEMIPGMEISWPGNKVPTKPSCGYQGEECLEQSIIIAIVVGALATMAIVVFIPYISLKYRKFQASRDWMMDMNVLTFLPLQSSIAAIQGYPSTYRLPNVSNRMSLHSLHSTSHSTSQKTMEASKININPLEQKTPEEMPAFVLATYASETVVLRKAKLDGNNLNKVLRQELKEMRWLVHDNLNRFLGICFPVKNSDIFYHISEYCAKGSLRSVLANDQMALDLSFKLSFIFDIAKGMQYLHQSAIKSHGILCSRLCFLDARWVTKISGYGSLSNQMFMQKNKKGADPEERFEKMLWVAPEVLRSEMPPKGSQKGDVYSFGIMLHEILTRNIPYSEAGKTNKAIIRDVMKRKEPPFRPALAELEGACQEANVVYELVDLMKLCWEELPDYRPDFHTINAKLKHIQKGRKEMNIMDSMLSKMEKYTENLEKVVSARTAQLLEEKAKTDGLLYRMLPEAVADSLKKGEPYLGEYYDDVTLYFSDIVGFTSLSAESTPMQVVTLLNDLYTCFDAVIEKFDVYKVETIGDAYMVSSGLPRRNGNQHAPQIANMSLAMVEAVTTFRIRHLPDRPCQIRIGINSGPVAAGVVGLTMPRFCLFGDTVNTASRMESNGLPQKIHVSSPTAALLDEIGGFKLEVRGQMKIKGKGVMNTFWLLGTDDEVEGQPQQAPPPLNNAGKKISTDTVISQDSVLSPPDAASTVSSSDCVVSTAPTDQAIIGPNTSNTSNDSTQVNDAKTLKSLDHNADDRSRSISDAANLGSPMPSIAEASETNQTAKHDSTLINNNTVNAMQHGVPNLEGTAVDPCSGDHHHTSPQKKTITVPPQVTDVPINEKPSDSMTEIPVLPNVVIYNSSKVDPCEESSFTYTTTGAKTIELESSTTFVKVYDA